MRKFSGRKSPVYFHITASGSVHLKGEELGEANLRGLREVEGGSNSDKVTPNTKVFIGTQVLGRKGAV